MARKEALTDKVTWRDGSQGGGRGGQGQWEEGTKQGQGPTMRGQGAGRGLSQHPGKEGPRQGSVAPVTEISLEGLKVHVLSRRR